MKQERLLSIQSQILERLGLNGRIPSPSTSKVTVSSRLNGEAGRQLIDTVQKNHLFPQYGATSTVSGLATPRSLFNDLILSQIMSPSPIPPGTSIATVTETGDLRNTEIYSQRLQSFYSSCRTPNGTEDDVWVEQADGEMKLYFDVNIPKSSSVHTVITVLWAKLRLFVYSEPGCLRRKKYRSSSDTSTYLNMVLCDTNTRTITLYQYRRSLKVNKQGKLDLI